MYCLLSLQHLTFLGSSYLSKTCFSAYKTKTKSSFYFFVPSLSCSLCFFSLSQWCWELSLLNSPLAELQVLFCSHFHSKTDHANVTNDLSITKFKKYSLIILLVKISTIFKAFDFAWKNVLLRFHRHQKLLIFIQLPGHSLLISLAISSFLLSLQRFPFCPKLDHSLNALFLGSDLSLHLSNSTADLAHVLNASNSTFHIQISVLASGIFTQDSLSQYIIPSVRILFSVESCLSFLMSLSLSNHTQFITIFSV